MNIAMAVGNFSHGNGSKSPKKTYTQVSNKNMA
jgi:hypothetical protein